MTNDTTIATITIPALAEAVFGVLADPATHQAIDGTGWVRESLDGESLTHTGQIFRIAMYHDDHPSKNYEMANKVVVFDRPHASDVALTYDWSAAPAELREHIGFPPFEAVHLENSLKHLSDLAVSRLAN